MVSEYLSEELSLALEKHLKLPAVTNSSNEENKEPPAKRQKMNAEPLEDYSKDKSLSAVKVRIQLYSLQIICFTDLLTELWIIKEKVQITAKSKALANAAKGSRNIASFFTKKWKYYFFSSRVIVEIIVWITVW